MTEEDSDKAGGEEWGRFHGKRTPPFHPTKRCSSKISYWANEQGCLWLWQSVARRHRHPLHSEDYLKGKNWTWHSQWPERLLPNDWTVLTPYCGKIMRHQRFLHQKKAVMWCKWVMGIFRKKKHLAKYVCSRKVLFSMFHVPYSTVLPDGHVYTI